MTPAQAGMLYVSLEGRRKDLYLQQLVVQLNEELDVQRFLASWDAVVRLHPVLRLRFIKEKNGRWMQRVYFESIASVQVSDWRQLPRGKCAPQFESRLNEDRLEGFGIETEAPHRLRIFLWPRGEARVVWTIHHSLLDGRSTVALMKECWERYDGGYKGRGGIDDYSSFIHALQGNRHRASPEYWRRNLNGFEGCDLTGYPSLRNSPDDGPVSRYRFEMDESFTRALNALLESGRFTANSVSLAAWFLLLQCHTGFSDLVTGTVRSCRYVLPPSLRPVAGLAINTLPFRTQIDPDQTICVWLEDLRSQWIEQRAHLHHSPPEVRSWSKLPASLTLFSTLHVHEGMTVQDAFKLSSPCGRGFRLINGRNEAALSVSTAEGKCFEVNLQADPLYLDPGQLAHLGQRYAQLLHQVVYQPDRPIRSIDCLTDSEKKQQLVDFNHTPEFPLPADSVYGAISRRAERFPIGKALVCQEGFLTYEELIQSAQSIGAALRRNAPSRPVAILLEDKAAMAVALTGVLACGRSFVPLDPAYPEDRLLHMMRDSRAGTLLTQTTHLQQAHALLKKSGIPGRILTLGSGLPFPVAEWETPRETGGPGHPEPFDGKDWVYVVYTSGTTGQPKGVPITNANLMPLMAWQESHFELGPGTRTISSLSFTFDFGLQEIFTTWMFGGTLFIPSPANVRIPEQFSAYLRSHAITMVYAVPSFMEGIVALGETMPSLRVILLGGERLYWKLVDELRRLLDPRCKIFNGYGPTEAAINCSMYGVDFEAPRYGDSVPIGRPSGKSSLYVLNRNGMPAPAGFPGELFIGGPGLSTGYLNQPELTAEKFVEAGFRGGHADRLYRSGDRVRFLPDGNLEFLGRFDNQVKLNGYRIELEEIEAQLGKHPAVKSVAVRLEIGEGGIPGLCAYVVPGDGELREATLRSFARKVLPSHMAPSRFWVIPGMPLTPNGKIDRARLSLPVQEEAPAPAVLPQRRAWEDWFYEICWKQDPPGLARLEPFELAEAGPYLIFGDGSPLCEDLVADLRRRELPVTGVKAEREDEVDVGFRGLLDEMAKGQRLPKTLIFFSEGSVSPLEKVETGDVAFTRFLGLIQAVAVYYRARSLRLVVVTRNCQPAGKHDLFYPRGALLHGLSKALPFEMPEVSWLGIDLDERSEDPSVPQFLGKVVRTNSGRIIAFREGRAYEWDVLPTALNADKSPCLRPGGTYLITGGLGALGMAFAEGMVKRATVNLVLLDTAAAVARFDKDRVSALSRGGSALHIVAADVCREEEMANALDAVRKRTGRMDGVIHAAGRVKASILQHLSEEKTAEVLGPKVWGTEILAKLLRKDELDFLILCSSIDAIRGSFNQADYCAANAFMDAFAHHLSQRGYPCFSVNWDVWRDAGMAARAQVAPALLAARERELALGIYVEEGVKILFQALGLGSPQLIVSTTPLKERIGRLGYTLEHATKLTDSELDTVSGPAKDDLRDIVHHVFVEVLGEPGLQDDDDFFQKGGNSLAAMRVVARLGNKLERNVSIRSVFEAPTVAKMLEWLSEG